MWSSDWKADPKIVIFYAGAILHIFNETTSAPYTILLLMRLFWSALYSVKREISTCSSKFRARALLPWQRNFYLAVPCQCFRTLQYKRTDSISFYHKRIGQTRKQEKKTNRNMIIFRLIIHFCLFDLLKTKTAFICWIDYACLVSESMRINKFWKNLILFVFDVKLRFWKNKKKIWKVL